MGEPVHRRNRVLPRIVLFLLTLFPPPPTAAQAQVVLEAPTTTLSRPLSSVGDVSELLDGRILVLDLLEQEVFVVDVSFDRATAVGRRGSGPGEYLGPTALLALPGGRTGILDGGNGRVLVLDGSGAPEGFLDPRRPASCPPSPVRLMPVVASDGTGHFYGQASPIRLGRDRLEPADRSAIERWRPEACTRDTVAFVSNPFGENTMIVQGIAVGRPGAVEPFAPRAEWALSAGGRVAVVSPDPYRVEVIDPDGSRVRGPTLRYDRVRVTDAIREGWLAERSGPVQGVGRDGGPITVQLPRVEPRSWPRFLPPFGRGSVHIVGEDRIWIQRLEPGAPARFDVMDGRGRRVGEVRLPDRTRLVGVGREHLYLVWRDEWDQEFLQRSPIPDR